MKQLLIIILIAIAPYTLASDAGIARYVQTEIKLLQNEITQLKKAIQLSHSSLQKRQYYQQVAELGFAASNKTLAESGFTVKSFYQFQNNHQMQIEQWLNENILPANQLIQLKTQRDNLIQVFDGANL